MSTYGEPTHKGEPCAGIPMIQETPSGPSVCVNHNYNHNGPHHTSCHCRRCTGGRRHPPAERPWHYSLCHCCSDCNSFLECCCCTLCQLSRQYNMIKHHKAELPCCTCFCLYLGTLLTGGLLFWGCVCCVREMIRDRYGIEGSSCGDCCTTCWCTGCAIQQQLLEMTSVGEFPSACCYVVRMT
ncbi:PLAC8 family, putative [Angomonas deanei]|uniref:PLAC8 family, putative n=1 Tax=Angomonas deanei TaxID=59799 RepID=A0A7G2CFR1_9TRYP|nr:PLAC8 family, putative [Angomonas deanei]